MKKLNSIAELKAAVKEFKPVLDLRENHTDAIPDKRDILVCGGTGCTSSDSLQIIENLKEEIEKAVEELKKVKDSDDINEIRAKIDELSKVTQGFATRVYQEAAKENATPNNDASNNQNPEEPEIIN